ncbi:hypothetical protein EDC01DRAFT_92599 [Geopyxis carbonaria]|nr:hypothetical protein EDC01DRAFT_92599 [Geopyxis carbonaria]
MPHSTFLSNHPPLAESRPITITTSPPAFTGSPAKLHQHSPSKSPLKPSALSNTSSPPRTRFILTRTSGGAPSHGRSKSLNSPLSSSPFAMSLPPPPPSPTRPMASYSPPRRMTRDYAPPLLRASSLPLVVPEGRPAQPSFTTTPPTPTTPQRTYPPSSPRRSASPTRIYASSLAASPRSYHSSSSFRAPSPPSHLVNEPSPTSTGPSTPTSLRSRSPSISSLETIPDTPDAEAEAVEAAARDAAAAAKDSTRRRSLDFDRVAGASGRWGTGADKRKRWSICGGEKRGDLDLETIWEEAVASAGAGRAREDDDLDSVDE